MSVEEIDASAGELASTAEAVDSSAGGSGAAKLALSGAWSTTRAPFSTMLPVFGVVDHKLKLRADDGTYDRCVYSEGRHEGVKE